MSTQDTAALIESVNKMTDTVAGKIGEIDQRVQQAEQTINEHISRAKDSLPFFNLLNNAKLHQFEDDGVTPSGFYIWAAGMTVSLNVIEETAGGWWQSSGRFLRVTISWDGDDGYSGSVRYAALWGNGQGIVPTNAPNFIKTTRGFNYKVVKDDGLSTFKIGWETGSRALDKSLTVWSDKETLTYQGAQAEAICSFYVPKDQPSGEVVIDLKNIFINLGNVDTWGLGINDLTSFPFTTLAEVKTDKEG